MARAKNTKITDPVEEASIFEESKTDKETLDISNISFSDVSAIPQSVAQRNPHPFDGYPEKKIFINEEIGKVSKHIIVAVNPTVPVFQDPSGKGQTMPNGRRVDLKTFHSRVVPDIENGGINTDIVFDREIKTAEGKILMCAFIPSHSARAQVCFKYDSQKNKIMADDRYLLFDPEQVNRLRKTFERVNYQQMRAERLAREFDSTPESTAADKE